MPVGEMRGYRVEVALRERDVVHQRGVLQRHRELGGELDVQPARRELLHTEPVTDDEGVVDLVADAREDVAREAGATLGGTRITLLRAVRDPIMTGSNSLWSAALVTLAPRPSGTPRTTRRPSPNQRSRRRTGSSACSRRRRRVQHPGS